MNVSMYFGGSNITPTKVLKLQVYHFHHFKDKLLQIATIVFETNASISFELLADISNAHSYCTRLVNLS